MEGAESHRRFVVQFEALRLAVILTAALAADCAVDSLVLLFVVGACFVLL